MKRNTTIGKRTKTGFYHLSGGVLFATIAFLFGSGTAHAQDATVPAASPDPVVVEAASVVETEDDSPLASSSANYKGGSGLFGMTRHLAPKTLEERLRHLGRDWPKLLLRYANPVARGLMADQRNGIALRTTFYSNQQSGLSLGATFQRNYWGNREGRINLTLRY